MARILVVEDERVTAAGTKALIEARFGYDVDTVADPEEVPQQMQRNSYEVALVDLVFHDPSNSGAPRQSGLNVFARLGSAQNPPRLVLFSVGDETRQLFMMTAFEKFNISGAIPKSAVEPMVTCLEEVLAQRRYIHPTLAAFQPRPGHSPSHLLRRERYRAFWAALAFGYVNHESIHSFTNYSQRYIQNLVGEIGSDLHRLGYTSQERPVLQNLINYAGRHAGFFRWAWDPEPLIGATRQAAMAWAALKREEWWDMQ